jgi:hypothetical protein
MSRAASETDMFITCSGLLKTYSATAFSAGLNISIALLILMRQPAFAGAMCFVRGIKSDKCSGALRHRSEYWW